MIIQGLFEELRDDPAVLGYTPLIAANNDEGVAALLNSVTLPVIGEISRADLTTWAASTGMRAVIEDVSKDVQSLLRSSALAILDVLKGSSGGIDLTKTANMSILDGWQAATLLIPENKASFIALATQNQARSVALFGKRITANDVARVVRDDVGTPLLGA